MKLKLLKYITLLSLVFNFVSCREDIRLKSETEVIADGWLQINFAASSNEIVKTRENEDEIRSLQILFFNSKNDNLVKSYYINDIAISDKGTKVALICLDDEVKNLDENSPVYVIVNKEIPEDITSISDLENFTENGITVDRLVMSWKGKKSFISDNKLGTTDYPIEVKRTVSKITVNSSVLNFTISGFEVINTAPKGYIIAPWKETDKYVNSESKTSTGIIVSKGSLLCYPTNSKQAYILLNGEFDGNSYWYKIAFKSEEKELSLEPNTHYHITVIEVSGPGHLSADGHEQWTYNNDVISYTIQDYSPGILSMVSDGLRELGVTREVKLEGNVIKQIEFEVRLSCIEETSNFSDVTCSHYPTISPGSLSSTYVHQIGDNYKVEIIEGGDWLSLSEVELILNQSNSDPSSSQNNSGISDFLSETPGRVIKYKLNVNSRFGGDLYGLIRVTWCGLTRDIPVVYQTVFLTNEIIGNTTLIMRGDEETYQIDGYWNVLKGEPFNIELVKNNNSGVLSGLTATLKGLQDGDMEEYKIRNQGLHFPVMQGLDPDNPWWYEYQISFYDSYISKFKYFTVDVISDKPEVWNEDIFHISLADIFIGDGNGITEPRNEFLIKRKQKVELKNHFPLVVRRAKGKFGSERFNDASGIVNDYEYSTAKLIIQFYKNENDVEYVEHSINLYHTGFFYYPGNPDGLEGIDHYFYYYEVVPMGKDNKGGILYWLDRNVAASSNRNYVEDEENTIIGEKGNAGWYCNLWNPIEESIMSEDIVCPPGYHIPYMSQWEAVLQSPDFYTQSYFDNGKDYFSSYYECDNFEIGRVYFPKGRLYQKVKESEYSGIYFWETSNTEAGGSGFYWTNSKNKEDNFYALNFNGRENNFIEGQSNCDWMYVRCVANTPSDNEEIHSIDLKVKGATHIYLYTVGSDGKKHPVSPFPGKEIALAKAVRNLNSESDESYLNFSHITTINPSNFYALFYYIDEYGTRKLISDNKADNLQEAEGWNLATNRDFFFYWDPSFTELTR